MRPKPYKDPPETLGERLCKKRTLRGSLLKDTARQLGINAWTYRNWEQDRTKPAVRFIPTIIDFLEYDPFPAPQTLGERIRARRQRLGLSQERLSKLLGVDEGCVMRWERGEWTPTALTRRRIDVFLRASP